MIIFDFFFRNFKEPRITLVFLKYDYVGVDLEVIDSQ